LLAGPSHGELVSPLPGVELLSVEVRDHRAYVDLSGGVNRLGGVDLTLADYCLTLSLTQLEGISSVSVTAEGRPIGQQPKQIFYEWDVLLSSMDDVLQTVEVTVYFLNSDNALTGEQRILELYEGQTLAESVIAALLEGPHNKDLRRALPEDFQVNFVRMENGVCYVNLPAASLEALPPDEDLQRKMLWSLTDSLYSIESIEELRLLADGGELTSFGMIPLDSALVRPKG
ncbi:MAG: GerMN domain-containing protein, partial [Oscillospiraceae bacterium]|nr:GerMN domain-containing protein [Oscillospiraceae bacterium]